jgi:hypothetical protein
MPLDGWILIKYLEFPAVRPDKCILIYSYSFIGSFIRSMALTYGGYQIGEHWEQIRAVMSPSIILLSALSWRSSATIFIGMYDGKIGTKQVRLTMNHLNYMLE